MSFLIKNKKKKKNIFGIISTALIFLIVLYGMKVYLTRSVDIKKLYAIKKIVFVGKNRFKVMTAVNPAEWKQGLMDIKKLHKNTGMFFIFPKKVDYPFWMKNTLIPLTVLFINKNKVVNQIKMTPCVTKKCLFYYPFVYYRQALEINQTNKNLIGKKIKTGGI